MESPTELSIVCANGIEPRLVELEQHSTYRGLLDGGPTHELNERLLADVMQFETRIPTHLVRPTERVLEHDQPSLNDPLVCLPGRMCTGLFDVGGARLTIVWFQDTWAPPIDSDVLANLKGLDFLALAFDELESW